MQMKIFMNRQVDFLPYIFFGVAALHLLTLGLPSVNLEFAFADASKYFINGDGKLLDQYFKYQANTIALPYLGYLVSKVLDVEPIYALRLLSTLGLYLIVLSVRKIAIFLKLNLSLALYLVLMLNPLVWTYAGRATADIFPASIALLSISICCCQSARWYRGLVSGMLFGLACSLKYHSIVLMPLIFLLLCSEKKWREILIYFCVFAISAISVVSLFIFFVFKKYGFFLAPPMYQQIHGMSINNPLNNFFGYAGFLLLLAVPFSFLPNLRAFKKKTASVYGILILFCFICFLSGYFFLKNTGELDFGPLDRWLSPQVASGLLSMFVFAGVFSLYTQIKIGESEKTKILMVVGVIVFLLVLSFTRPAQRYLLFVLPFIYLIVNAELLKVKSISFLFLIALMSSNVFIAYSQWSTGVASQGMVNFLVSNNMLHVTDPGDIESHVGNFFAKNNQGTCMYKVISGRSSNSLYTSESPYFLGKKSYSLIPMK